MNTHNTPKDSREFLNETHIIRKKKAEAKQVSSKNYKKLAELIDLEDDEEDISEYVRYIK